MPSLPSYSRLTGRSDARASSINPLVVAPILLCIAAIVVFVIVVKFVGLEWWRDYKDRKAAKAKAIADRKAWYRSTRPIMRRPETPRILILYTRSPHIQYHQEIGSPAIAPLDMNHSEVSGNTDVSRQIERSHFTDALPVTMEPFPDFVLNQQPIMESGSDLGLQLLDNHHSGSTMSTTVSLGVAVPMNLPVPMSPTEVYTSRHTSEELDSDEPFVIGDHIESCDDVK